MSEFVLHVNDIQDDVRNYEFPITTEWLARELEGTDVRVVPSTPPGHLSVRASRSGEDILIDGHVEATVVTDCVRCLGDASVSVGANITAFLSPAPSAPSLPRVGSKAKAKPAAKPIEDEEDELSEEDLVLEHYSGDEIVLDTLVREHILLEVPMQPRCSETCEGIAIPAHVKPPADFGEKPNVDPRFAPLKKIAEKLGKG